MGQDFFVHTVHIMLDSEPSSFLEYFNCWIPAILHAQ
jgi:hypothetical protein